MVKSISKNTINNIRQLHTLKHRNQTGQFIAEGEKIVGELLISQFRISMIACLPEYFEQHESELENLDVNLVSADELSRISLLQTPNQILAVVEKPATVVPELNKPGLYLLLDGIRDPGNMGTMIRTAEWFGVNAIICSPDCVEIYNPKVVQGSMGSLFRMPIFPEDLTVMIENFQGAGVNTITGAVLGGELLKTVVNKPATQVLVIGSEALGISDKVKNLLTTQVTIPGAFHSKTESLNAAVACGIMLYAMS